jgi:hypothetical protein
MSHFYESLHPDDVPPWHLGDLITEEDLDDAAPSETDEGEVEDENHQGD